MFLSRILVKRLIDSLSDALPSPQKPSRWCLKTFFFGLKKFSSRTQLIVASIIQKES